MVLASHYGFAMSLAADWPWLRTMAAIVDSHTLIVNPHMAARPETMLLASHCCIMSWLRNTAFWLHIHCRLILASHCDPGFALHLHTLPLASQYGIMACIMASHSLTTDPGLALRLRILACIASMSSTSPSCSPLCNAASWLALWLRTH